jgi:hypothetical protein
MVISRSRVDLREIGGQETVLHGPFQGIRDILLRQLFGNDGAARSMDL